MIKLKPNFQRNVDNDVQFDRLRDVKSCPRCHLDALQSLHLKYFFWKTRASFQGPGIFLKNKYKRLLKNHRSSPRTYASSHTHFSLYLALFKSVSRFSLNIKTGQKKEKNKEDMLRSLDCPLFWVVMS